MRTGLWAARMAAILVLLALISAACAPIPVELPTGLPPVATAAPAVSTPPGSPLAPPPTAIPSASATEAATAVASPTPTPAPLALVGPTWEWVASRFKDGTTLTPGDPSRYTFQLLDDGNAMVQADCNFGTGSYQQSGANLAFGVIGTTKMACPPDSLDSAFLAQLRNVASYSFTVSELVLALKDEAGTMRLRAAAVAPAQTTSPTQAPAPTLAPAATESPAATAAAAADSTEQPAVVPATPVLLGTPVPAPTSFAPATVLPALSGTRWLLVSLTVDGEAIKPVGATPITLEIAADGSRIMGSTGCNDYQATFGRDVNGATIVGPSLKTEKACAANLMVQEVEFIDALLRTRSYVVQGNELTLIDAAGNTLLAFVKS